GVYQLEDLVEDRVGFHFSGSDNHFDLSGVKIYTPISVYGREKSASRRSRSRGGFGTIDVSGDRVQLEGGTFENLYPRPLGPITDFGSYNQDVDLRPWRGVTEVRLRGDDLRVSNCRFTVRGSFPYGYGNIYGIGQNSAVPLRKHSGILITGDRVDIDRCSVKMEAFGHAIFVQGGDQITVRNCDVEGGVRPSNDLYQETHPEDLARRFHYQIQWPENVRGLPIPRDHMINLTEDGIRAYSGTGHITVENCKVTRCRGGIKLYMAKSATVRGCEVRDCVIQGYSIPSRGTIERSRGNAAYGPLLYVHMDSHTSQQIDLEVLPAPHALGDHPLAAIKGRKHRIRLWSRQPISPGELRPIIVGYPLRFDFLSQAYPDVPEGYEAHFERYAPDRYRAEGIHLRNETHHPVVMGSLSTKNRVESRGVVRGAGQTNEVIPLAGTEE
ncbi:MAG: right-handed parallel beta-helix repeat-containing protein, partial [Verrucomicrobiales bacterium]